MQVTKGVVKTDMAIMAVVGVMVIPVCMSTKTMECVITLAQSLIDPWTEGMVITVALANHNIIESLVEWLAMGDSMTVCLDC